MSLSGSERAALDTINPAVMLQQVEAWAAVNSGSRNLPGLAVMAEHLAAAFAPLGDIRLMPPAAATQMLGNGAVAALPHGDNLHLCVRPQAPVRVLLTGHYDTVFGVDHPFQSLQWLQAGVLNGPGVADMKGGIAVMLAALQAFEHSAWATKLGYEVVLNADEEVSSPGSAPLLTECAARVNAGLTFEPALADGTLAGGRPGISRKANAGG